MQGSASLNPAGIMSVLRAALALGLTAAVTAAPAHAQNDFPAKPIRYVVAVAPGGINDFLARVVGAKLNEAWGQPVIVDNRPGSGGNIGANVVAKSQPDGYTILNVSLGHAVNVTLYSSLPYDLRKDLAPVSFLASAPLIACVPATLPVKSINELVAYAKSNPVNYAIGFTGSISHVSVEVFKRQMGIEMNQVPYNGGGPAATALASNQVQVLFNAIPELITFVRGGRVRALAVASAKRTSLLPDVPTMAEQGVKDFEMGNWVGVMTRAGTPQPVIKKLAGEIDRILKLPDVREKLLAQGFDIGGGTPEQFTKFLNAEIERWGKVVKAAGARAD
jgi:tripartite-type tricarboxylate transporter receptor subunit TctC